MTRYRGISHSQALEEQIEKLEQALLGIERLLLGAEKDSHALAYLLEQAAWAVLESAKWILYDRRIPVPKKETSAFDTLFQAGLLPIEMTRPLRQLCDFRKLSSLDLKQQEIALESSFQAELELFRNYQIWLKNIQTKHEEAKSV